MPESHHLLSKTIQSLSPYQSARRIGGVGKNYVNANEAPYAAYYMPDHATWNRYPDFLPSELAQVYADYAEVEQKQTLAVRGADEGIDLLVRAFCQPTIDKIIITSPTYGMYEFVAQAHSVEVIDIPLDSDFELNHDEIIKRAPEAKIIFLCRPNNPTGAMHSIENLLAIANKVESSTLVVVDEAYVDFCPTQSLTKYLANTPNLIILRTLSKAFAMAAVRVGFILAQEPIIEGVSKLIAPYPIPDPCSQAAIFALSAAGIEYMQNQTKLLKKLTSFFSERLNEMPCVEQVYPANGNFVLVKFNNSPAIFAFLQEVGIIVRDQHHIAQLQNHLRISIGSTQDMMQIIDKMEQYCRDNNE